MEEKELFRRIKDGDESAFEALFRKYYASLCGYATRYLSDSDQAEEIVQNLFCRFWEKKAEIDISTSTSSYLYSAVRNSCLNNIRQKKSRAVHHETIGLQEDHFTNNNAVEELELDQKIEQAIQDLPEASRRAFVLSRVDGLKYADIAKEMNISVKAVEANISRALKKLRHDLKDFLTSIILFFWMMM